MLVAGYNESFNDYPDKDSICISIFFAGCSFHCENCHNQELQFQSSGTNTTVPEILNKVKDFQNITLMGGEPLEQNLPELRTLIKSLLADNKNVCLYTGYSIKEAMVKLGLAIINTITYIKCGQYVESMYQSPDNNDKELILASKNQNLFRKGKLVSINGIYDKKMGERNDTIKKAV